MGALLVAVCLLCPVLAAVGSREQSLQSRPDTLGTPAELAWQAWLLAHSSAPTETRRIIPKSVFITPVFSEPAPAPQPDCGEGFRPDAMGRCVQLVKVNQAAQLDFLLQRLNAMYAHPVQETLTSLNSGPVPPQPLQVSLAIPITSRPEPGDPAEVDLVVVDVFKEYEKSEEDEEEENQTPQTIIAMWNVSDNSSNSAPASSHTKQHQDNVNSAVNQSTQVSSHIKRGEGIVHSENSDLKANRPVSVIRDESGMDVAGPASTGQMHPTTERTIHTSVSMPPMATTSPVMMWSFAPRMTSPSPVLPEHHVSFQEPPSNSNNDTVHIITWKGNKEGTLKVDVIHPEDKHQKCVNATSNVAPSEKESDKLLPDNVAVTTHHNKSGQGIRIVPIKSFESSGGLEGYQDPSINQQDHIGTVEEHIHPHGHVRFPTKDEEMPVLPLHSSTISDEYQNTDSYKGNLVTFPKDYSTHKTPISEPDSADPNSNDKSFWWLPPGWRLDQSRHRPILLRFWSRIPLHDGVRQHRIPPYRQRYRRRRPYKYNQHNRNAERRYNLN